MMARRHYFEPDDNIKSNQLYNKIIFKVWEMLHIHIKYLVAVFFKF